MRRRKLSSGGFTFLEMMITGFLFIFFLLQLGNIWAAYDKWFQYLGDRLEVDIESRMARKFLTADLSRTQDVLVGSSSCVLSLDDTQPGRLATYRFQAPFLMREGDDPTQLFPVAAFVQQAGFGLDSHMIGSAQVSIGLRDNGSVLSVYMSRVQE